jgi:molybdopterin molybdotransferase
LGALVGIMISFDEALDSISAIARPLGNETVAVNAATGRVLAAPVIAQIPSPRCDVSAMDGYAVRDGDLAVLPARLRVIGESFAGGAWKGAISSGECIRIFTGAPVPDGLDRVVIQEDVGREGDVAIFVQSLGTARHIRARAGDFNEGDELLGAGQLLDKRAIVVAAAADLAEIEVFKRVRVSILSTGDELAEPGKAAARPDAIPESVSLGIAGMVGEWGGEVVDRRRLRDDLPSMESAAAAALHCSDLIVVTGGASVGEKDFAKTMFESAGLELIFSKVSIKPGKPVWLGGCGSKWVMGLPGNPTSALVTARLLLAPLIAGLSGQEPERALRWRLARLTTALNGCGPRETFHRGRWAGDRAEILSFQDSSAQKVLADADLLIRQRANTPALSADEPVQVLDF